MVLLTLVSLSRINAYSVTREQDEPTHLIRTPMALRKAWVSASVLLISKEKISLPAREVKGVSWPRD